MEVEWFFFERQNQTVWFPLILFHRSGQSGTRTINAAREDGGTTAGAGASFEWSVSSHRGGDVSASD